MSFGFFLNPTPLGDHLTVLSARGVCWHQVVEDPTVPWLLEEVSQKLGTPVLFDPTPAAQWQELLDSYFSGAELNFLDHINIDWRLTQGFHRAALQAVGAISWGRTAAYSDVAEFAGNPRAARAVGTACRQSPISLLIPVHRVIRSDGSVGQYGTHSEHKEYLLNLERNSPNNQNQPGSPFNELVMQRWSNHS